MVPHPMSLTIFYAETTDKGHRVEMSTIPPEISFTFLNPACLRIETAIGERPPDAQ